MQTFQMQITLVDELVTYTLKLSPRARTLRLSISYDDGLVVVAPERMREVTIQKFLQGHAAWIVAKLAMFRNAPPQVLPKATRGDYTRYKEAARTLAAARLAHFNQHYHFRYNAIAIKNQKTRWGSCSGKGNLNFSYKIVHLPPNLADYIIVHELCHLKEMNHSKRFWDLVGETMPDYKERRVKLRRATSFR